MVSPKKKPDYVEPLPAGTATVVKKLPVRDRPQKAQTLGDTIQRNDRAKMERMGLVLYTLLFVYKNLYILGITLLRRLRRGQRRLRRGVAITKGNFYGLVHRLSLFIGRVYSQISRRLRTPFQRIRDAYRQQLPQIQRAKDEGVSPLPAYLPVAEAVGRLAWRVVATVLNHALPVVAAVGLISVVQNTLDKPVALRLVYDGQPMGYVQNELVFDQATQIVRERVLDQAAGGIAIGEVSFSIEEVDPRRMLDSSEIANLIISRSGSDVQEAYGLYIGGRFMGAVTDKDAIIGAFNAIRAEQSTGKPNERTKFTKKIEFNPALFPASSLVDAQTLVQRMRQNESESESYIVQEGDTPTEIAEKNGMRYADLLALNPDIEENLMPGDEINTRVARPFLTVMNIFTDVYEEEIPYETEEDENNTFAVGYRKVTQEGVNGLRTVKAEITTVGGIEVERTVLNPDDPDAIIRHPVTERVTVGINKPTQTASQTATPNINGGVVPQIPRSSGFAWPTNGGRATTYSGHSGNGVDIAPGGAGHPIYAAAPGVVTKVVNGYTGYGHYVMIDHQDGFVTLYAHNSANTVSVGQYVSQGQVIGYMGHTGWATGNHLHFEVRYNGRYMNPTDYIGYRG